MAGEESYISLHGIKIPYYEVNRSIKKKRGYINVMPCLEGSILLVQLKGACPEYLSK